MKRRRSRRYSVRRIHMCYVELNDVQACVSSIGVCQDSKLNSHIYATIKPSLATWFHDVPRSHWRFLRSFARQTHKVWPNMDTSLLNEWHTGLVGISAWRRAPSRHRVSRVPRYSSTSSDVYYDAHAFPYSYNRAPTTLRARRLLNEPRR